jgi:uncharacterized membrane protein
VEAGSKRRRQRWGREEDGVEFARIVSFSDGVFAIAITLLVLSLHIPEHLGPGDDVGDALLDQQGDLIAYAISFAVIGRLWLVHHRFFAEVTHSDGALIALNLVYLGFVVLIPFASEVLGDHGDTGPGVVLYATNLAIVNFLGGAMYIYAARAGLTRESFQRYVEQPLRLRNIAGGLIFAASIPIAFFSRELAVLIWIALFFVPGPRER